MLCLDTRMQKIKITVATIGHMPADFKKQKIKEWQSSVFEIVDEVESYSLTRDSDGYDWEFSDTSLEQVLPSNFSGDFLIAIVNVPIELNWYSRRLTSNRVVFSFHEIKDILQINNIPLENVIYRLLYAYTLLFKRSGNQIPDCTESDKARFTHDETRGCLFDMNGIKTDVVHSCHNPIICSDCVERLRREKVSEETISKCQTEIRRIRKTLFFRLADFIKKHPLWSIAISGGTAILLGLISSIIASYIFAALTK
jgi:hypothetical protein